VFREAPRSRIEAFEFCNQSQCFRDDSGIAESADAAVHVAADKPVEPLLDRDDAETPLVRGIAAAL
jgi:hypothetical protein